MTDASAAQIEATARSAEPLLASQLISDEDLDSLLESVLKVNIGTGSSRKERLGTGVKSLDDALNGGLEGGRVVGISGEAGAGGSEICRTLLANSLLKYDNSTAAVIDTTGNFDVLRLYTLIVSQLQHQRDVISSLRVSTGAGSEAKVEDVAAKVLGRVKIMRVFDFVGVREAVSEIRDGLEGRRNAIKSTEKKDEAKQPTREEEPVERPVAKRTYVADSEDEDDDDEMLFDTETTITQPAPPVQIPEPQPAHATKESPETEEDTGVERGKVQLILIDNLAQVLNPLLKKDYIQANALASTFLTTLTNLTQTYSVHTILSNPATTPRAPSPTRQPGSGQPAPPQQQRPEPPPCPSIFASNTAVPALMNLLGRYADMHLLVTRLPKKKIDARVHYADSGGGAGKGKKRGVEIVGVLEVVSDRWEGRRGDWGTFVEGSEGLKYVN